MSKKDEEYIKVSFRYSDKESDDLTREEIDNWLCDWIETIINKYGTSINLDND
jgi:hypothetical protein